MVQCAAFNCTNKTGNREKISLFTFPKFPRLRKEWTLRLKRKDFVPTDYSRLCQVHFAPESFTKDPRIVSSIRYDPKSLRLKPDAVPTIFNFSSPTSRDVDSERANRDRTPSVYHETPSRKRSTSRSRYSRAIQKRRRFEMLADITDMHQDENEYDSVHYRPDQCHIETQTEIPGPRDKCVGTDDLDTGRFSVGCQTSYNIVQRRHVSLQVTSARPKSSCGVQATCMMENTSTQCTRYKKCVQVVETGTDQSLDDYQEEVDSSTHDPDWVPTCETEDDNDETADNQQVNMDTQETEPDKAKKYVVFEQCLMELLDSCPDCMRTSLQHVRTIIGTCVCFSSRCMCGFTRQWCSQPFSKSMPWGNIIIASAIFFSGNSPVKTLNFMHHAGISRLCCTSYNMLQRTYIVPSTLSCWQFQQSTMFEQLRNSGQKLKLGGDARCSSPGHTAKYGSYTLMDAQTSKVIDVQLVQSNEVKNSYGMELEGLKRALHHLQEEGMTISDLVTDRHSQVKKFMRTECPSINHWFDVWHVAKGVYKKLEALGKTKKYALVGQWARSIGNHVYWCAASSDGDGELVRQKWTSITNHIANIHESHGDKFQSCQHGNLDRIWFKPGSKALGEVKKIVHSKLLLKDIGKLSPAEQTSSLESYHNIVNFFAPKSTHYFYNQMKARVCLAALHFNANSSRSQAMKDGKGQYRVSFPKSRKGDPVAKEVKVKQNFDYIQELMEEVVVRREMFSSYGQAQRALIQEIDPAPPSISGQRRAVITNYDRDTVIQNTCRRFNSYPC